MPTGPARPATGRLAVKLVDESPFGMSLNDLRLHHVLDQLGDGTGEDTARGFDELVEMVLNEWGCVDSAALENRLRAAMPYALYAALDEAHTTELNAYAEAGFLMGVQLAQRWRGGLVAEPALIPERR